MTLTEEITLADARGKRVGWRGWAALAVLMLPVLLVSVDNTVLSFALPDIALALGPSSAQQLWIIDAYPLVLAGLLVTMGTLGDRFGRRRMLLIGATGFAAAGVNVGVDEAGADTVDPDPFLRDFARKTNRERLERALRRGVGGRGHRLARGE